jgi:hypothetical protein
VSLEDIDEERFVAGFVLNKLYTLRCFARKGSHGKHTELLNIPKGFPKGLLKGAVGVISTCRRMNGNLVIIFKSTYEDHVCALIEANAIRAGLLLCNYYRERVRLRPFDDSLREVIEDAREDKKEEDYRKLSEEEERRTAREGREVDERRGIELIGSGELILRRPLDHSVQVVFDVEPIRLRIANLSRRRHETLGNELLDHALDGLECQSCGFSQHRYRLLHVAYQEALIQNARFSVPEYRRQRS